jgi:alkylation response protein AidB-like acyl-CoA dehydrogenase
MKFALPDDAVAIRDALRGALEADCGPELVRSSWSIEGESRVRGLWQFLGEMGVLGLLVPEADGGLGCDELFLVAAFEEMGYAAAPGPIGDSATIVAPLLAASTLRDGLLREVIDGSAIVACSLDAGPVQFAQLADAFLIPGPNGPELARRDQVEVAPLPTIDSSRRSGLVSGSGLPLDAAPLDVEQATLRATLAAAAELVGLGMRMLDITTGYVLGREQFGVPIGSFQSVKHMLANSLIAVEFARPAVWRAAVSLSSGDPEMACHVSMAKVLASDAARRTAKSAIQCHGAMGYTVEYDLHLFVKRAWARCADWGDSDLHTARVASSLGIH